MPNVTYTCEISECNDGFKPDAKGLKCEKTSEQKKKEQSGKSKADEAYSKTIDSLIKEYKQLVDKIVADCKKQGGILRDDGCKSKPQKEQKNGDK